MLHTRLVRPTLATAAVLALAAGCGGSGGDDDTDRPRAGAAASYETGLVNIPEAGEPVDGGTLTFAAFSEPALLDPAETIVAGSTGGLEMAAIYDVLLRWDSATNEVVPQLAESISANADATEWTLTLREGVTFSDGTPLDAAAVKWSLERYVEKGADEAMLWSSNVTGVATPDERTVVFTLAGPWTSFDYMLTTGPGMIVAQASDAGDAFTPVGAGAFTLAEQRPQEEIVLAANPDYWDGRPHLDEVRVKFLNDPTASLDSLESDAVDAAFLRDADLVDELVEAKSPGFLNLVSLGNVAVINAAEGRPGADPRVRQAMHHAIDPKLVAQRAFDGAGIASNAVFPEPSQWASDVAPLPTDPERAKELLEEAKADGFDGKITYLDASDPASRATALAVQASLEAVGFEVETDLVRDVQSQIAKVAVEQDYDVAGWGISWREAGPYGRMFATLHSEGNLSVGMHTGPEMDALFDEFREAAGQEEQRDVMARIQEQWNVDVPALVYGPTTELLAWDDDVHGVVDSTNTLVLLDDAWVAGS
ncbi:MAG TPA: ABC transporter substrate-binding protein [Nocardioides sp.]|uniref:ABC transporter substrate-binding protein n=1 Tax=Nocardioides sp. TaxID=35761 RepID=UPI002BA5C4B7|nr:ABC transporter substrate-binding protein [Nocardioides sp.]HTW15036.1 ABC transporter substrate-binding protein [Nocardioides sp.]